MEKIERLQGERIALGSQLTRNRLRLRSVADENERLMLEAAIYQLSAWYEKKTAEYMSLIAKRRHDVS
jgi:hypothetical protein